MQELKLIVAESDTSSLVLRGVDSHTDYFLPVTSELCSLLADATPVPSEDSSDSSFSSATGSSADQESQTGATVQALSSVVDGSSDASAQSAHSAQETGSIETVDAEIVEDVELESSSPTAHASTDLPAASGETTEASTDSSVESSTDAGASSVDASGDSSANSEGSAVDEQKSEAPAASTPAAVSGTGDVEKKRRHRIKINMTPRTIQDRVRHGASVAELAKEADTDESRIEPYAWPILQERSRIADLAHAAHPVSGDGPNKNTLWEVLATALAARGATLSDAEWDAHQDESRRWVITVTWKKEAAGQTSTHSAEFLFEKCNPSPDLVHPHNSVASDLIDPRYGQPIRRMAAVTPLLGGPATPSHDEDDYSEYDQYDDQGEPTGSHPAARKQRGQEGPAAGEGGRERRGGNQQRGRKQGARSLNGRDAAGSAAHGANGADDADGEDFLLHPDAEDNKPKRKRKAVTPHWEDVLLGVRTNPRKKK